MSSSPPKRLEDLSLAQRDRLACIDFRLYFSDEVGRPDLIERFGVAPAGATRDLALYREIVPHNITFDGSNKIYHIGQGFLPLFGHVLLRILSAPFLGFGDGVSGSMQVLLPCEFPATLSVPKMDVLAMTRRGIHAKRPIVVHYHSMNSGESKRVIVPFALVNTGLRWHIRAFDRKSREFRDFVVTRIEEPTLLDEELQTNERLHNDIQRTRIVELDFVPHPSAGRPDIIKMDYEMTDGSVKMRIRATAVGYMLQRRRVDCSPGHCLHEPGYQL